MPDASVSEVARRFGIARRVICRWRQELATAGPDFVDVAIIDVPLDGEEMPANGNASARPSPVRSWTT